MKLYAALGGSLLFSTDPMPETEAVWGKALEIAESITLTGHTKQVIVC
jgi:glutamate/tyrosine decarboxylase-like PLP-dependent enzyme